MTIRLHREDPAAEEVLRSHPLVSAVEARGVELRFEYRGDPGDFHEVVKLLVDRRIPIVAVSEAARDLEKLFLEVTDGRVG